MAMLLYVRSGGPNQIWHIVRHPPRRGDPIWDHRPALCGATGTGAPWLRRQTGWYEHEFGRDGPKGGQVCLLCRESANSGKATSG